MPANSKIATKDQGKRLNKPQRRASTERKNAAANEPDPYADLTPEDAARQRRYDVLQATVDQDIRAAIASRETSGIEDIWAEDDDQYNGVDELSSPFAMLKTRDQAPRQSVQDARSKVFVPITKPKTDIGVARVSEMLLPNDDKPWDIEPTPIPELQEALEADASDTVELGDGTRAPVKDVAEMHMAKAKEFAEKEATWIEDRFAEGSVYSEMRQVVRDAGRIGTGVLKGPHPVRRITKKWKVSRTPTPLRVVSDTNPQVNSTFSPAPVGLSGITSTLERIEKIEPTSTCIRAQDCYPDPSCGDSIHNGAFFVERAYLTGKQIKALAFLPGYDAKCIVEGLREGPLSYKTRFDNRARQTVGDSSYETKLFEVFYYYGDLSPEDMELLNERTNPYPGEKKGDDADDGEPDGDLDDKDDDTSALAGVLSLEERRYLRTVPVLVTMLNGRPIKADLNPMETGGFPYDFFPWETVKGQPWGRGIPRKMGVAQRILNAATRALLENAGMSAGPQIVTMKGKVTPWNGAQPAVRGRMGWDYEPDDATQDPDVRKAFGVFDVPSIQVEMSAIIQYALDLCDMLTNLPMLMQGDQQAGTSPETLGGMKLLFNNAMSPLRVIAKLYDDRLIVPHLQRYHDWAMEKGPDNIKGGDSRIVAKGSTALIQREEGREFLLQVFPVKDDPTLRIDPAKLIVEMARSNGFDMSRVQYTDEEWKAKQEELAKNPPPTDPAIEAAKIRSQALVDSANIKAQSTAADLHARSQMAALDRAHDEAMKAVDRELATMEREGKRSDALMALKGRLAEAAAANRLKSDEMGFKLMPENKSGLGI